MPNINTFLTVLTFALPQLLSVARDVVCILFFLLFYLFIHERYRQREKQAPCREPDVGLTLGLQDHALGRSQTVNH